MIWLKPYVDAVKLHLKAGSEQSLTYAALEVRLGLERFCYERLRNAHKYISHDDIRGWTPNYVVNKIVSEVDENIVSEYTLSISTMPANGDDYGLKDFESHDYVPIGTQLGFDPKKISKLWQAMSSFIHTKLPRAEADNIEHYQDLETMTGKVREGLEELERLSQATLMGALVPQITSFECVCGQKNSRSTKLLQNKSTISCIRESCQEQYIVHIHDEDIQFERRKIDIKCKCGNEISLPYKPIADMPRNTLAKISCEKCAKDVLFAWKLMQATEG
jgi:hypothetical protein